MKAFTYAKDFSNSTQYLFLTATLIIFGLRHVKIFEFYPGEMFKIVSKITSNGIH